MTDTFPLPSAREQGGLAHAGASRQDIDLWSLQLPPGSDLPDEDPAPDASVFAYLEAIHRLTMGVRGAWADSVAVSRAYAALMGEGHRFIQHSAQRGGLVEAVSHKDGRQAFMYDKGVRVMVRLTAQGVAEHFAWRPALLPAFDGAGQ